MKISIFALVLTLLSSGLMAQEITCKDKQQQVFLKFQSPINQDYREPIIVKDYANLTVIETNAFVQERTPGFIRMIGFLNEFDHYILELNFDQVIPSDNPWSPSSGFKGHYVSDIFPQGFPVSCFIYSINE